MLADVWHAGRQVVLPAFDPARALDLIEAERITATLVVPTMLAAICDEQLARPRDASSLALISHGGAPVATETLRRAPRRSPTTELMHIYGATETAPIATIFPHEELLLDAPAARSLRPAGRRRRGRASSASRAVAVPAGEVGEVAIRGDNVMAGYWNKPAQTAEALATAGIAPATSATWTTTASCTWSTAPRT